MYALFAFGYTLIYGVTGTFNAAHPVSFVSGVFSASKLLASGQPLWVAVLGGIVGGGIAGAIVDRIALWPSRLRSYGPLGVNQPIIASAALWTAFAALAARAPNVPMPIRAAHNPDAVAAAVCAVAIALLLVSWLVMRQTLFGIGVRAVALNPAAARAAGVDVEWITAQSSFFASSLGAAAGIAFSLTSYQGANPTAALMVQAGALAAVMLGGLGSLPGAVLAAFVVAAAQHALVATFPYAGYPSGLVADAAIVIVALALLPRGLMPAGALRSPSPR